MSMRKLSLLATGAAALALGATFALAETPHLGKPVSPADISAWDINVLPDGSNLPAGGAKAAEGQKIFAEKCAACHGEKGEGGLAARLIGGPPKATLDGGKGIANYYPYATTVFDFIRRSMPWNAPRTLTNQEVYALTAFILAGNKLIGEDEEMNATTLPKVKMPNRDNFVVTFPDKI
jgi:S-disulfanyl-L-cysteine oxidoreductase SoxD